eukprot:m.361209 g.361209  ORF g.361209 m.361209 type:complete len:205 (+) comp19417_c0_seq1:133-747(+)
MVSLVTQVDSAIGIIREAVARYTLQGICISFNGGKDSTVILHLLMQAYPQEYKKVKFVYFSHANEFPEVEAFIAESDSRFELNLTTLDMGFQEGVKYLTEEMGIKAFLMGTRQGDPYSLHLNEFSPSDEGWPDFMRVNPILSWSYATVWQFLSDKYYCELYDQGYTSLGNTKNTVRNPTLRSEDGTYKPAKYLQDPTLERHGRT